MTKALNDTETLSPETSPSEVDLDTINITEEATDPASVSFAGVLVSDLDVQGVSRAKSDVSTHPRIKAIEAKLETVREETNATRSHLDAAESLAEAVTENMRRRKADAVLGEGTGDLQELEHLLRETNQIVRETREHMEVLRRAASTLEKRKATRTDQLRRLLNDRTAELYEEANRNMRKALRQAKDAWGQARSLRGDVGGRHSGAVREFTKMVPRKNRG